jgi:hypothetical protein
MFTNVDVLGVVTMESIQDLRASANDPRLLSAYRTYLEDCIESRYKVTCTLATAESGALQLRIAPRLITQLTERELYDFEKECRQGFRERKQS